MKAMKRILLIALALCLCLCMTFADTAADNSMADVVEPEENRGNLFASGTVSGKTVGMDVYNAAENVVVENCEIGAAALLAGQDITVDGTAIGGSLRAAGQNLTINGTTIANNATVAGYRIAFDENSSAAGVLAACSDFRFAGTCVELYVGAGTVTISGTVLGDAHITADQVIIADGANIAGTLRVSASQAPSIAAGASVGGVDFTQIVKNTEHNDSVQHWIGLSKVTALLLGLGCNLVLAVLYYLTIRRTTRDACFMITGRPVAMPITGLVSFIAVPFATLLLLVTIIGIPAALLMLVCYGLILAFSLSFLGCAVGQRVFPHMHPLLASLIGVAVFTLVQAVPYLGVILTILCMLYALGFFIQKIYLGFPKAGKAPMQDPNTAEL